MVDLRRKRRITEQLILYWYELKKERQFPSIAEIHPNALEEVWDDCFLVEILEKEGKRRHHYTYIGQNIQDMFGGDLNSASVMTLADGLSSKYFEVVETRRPIVDEGEFHNMHDQEIRYRQILLPVGPNDHIVDHVLGGIRYKLFDNEEKQE